MHKQIGKTGTVRHQIFTPHSLFTGQRFKRVLNAYIYSKCTPIWADSKIPSGSLSIHMTPVCIMMEYVHRRIISNSKPQY